MTQTNVDDQFLNGLHLMIDSIESSYLEKADDADDNVGEDDLPEADHWCPDVQAWHTSDHEPANAPSVHVNVDNGGEDDSHQTDNESDTGAWEDEAAVEKGIRDTLGAVGQGAKEFGTGAVAGVQSPEAAGTAPTLAGRIGERTGAAARVGGEKLGRQSAAMGRTFGEQVKEGFRGPVKRTPELGFQGATARGGEVAEEQAKQKRMTQNIGTKFAGAEGRGLGNIARVGTDIVTKPFLSAQKQDVDDLEKISVAATLKDVEHGRDRIESEYDQNTNLDRQEQENSPSSIAEPFLNRYDVRDDEEDEEEEENVTDDSSDIHKSSNDFIESLVQTHAKSIDILKIWGSVDRVLPKTYSDITLINDIDILKSFDLDETTNIEDLIKGTLVHKMLVDRTSRPTADWWESSMLLAKSIDAIDEPAFFSAFLYYEPDTFDITDFVEIEKAEVTRGKAQDLEMMPNTSGGSAIDGLGMSADSLERDNGPEDDECDD
jgi:hypothetical protein